MGVGKEGNKSIIENHVQEKAALEIVPEPERACEEARMPGL